MSQPPLAVTIVGASGYSGGEVLRWLAQHPGAQIRQAISRSQVGRYVHQVHPHLRNILSLRFDSPEALAECDVLFLALPHGEAQRQIEYYAQFAPMIIDLSADFRLNSPADYAQTYNAEHQAPDWLARFIYGLPEIHRADLQTAHYVSGVGCNASATIFAVWALVQAGWLADTQPLFTDVKVGSSEAGRTPSDSSHHPARSGVVRPFSLTGHRHEAEVRQALASCGVFDVRMAITSVEMVRGVSAAVHVSLPTGLADKDFWQVYRAAWQHEPFVRIVHERAGLHRHPEPRLLAGTNWVDVGWEYDPHTGRAVLLAALDNLGKGAAGSAVQCFNLMSGFAESTGLNFGGIYP